MNLELISHLLAEDMTLSIIASCFSQLVRCSQSENVIWRCSSLGVMLCDALQNLQKDTGLANPTKKGNV